MIGLVSRDVMKKKTKAEAFGEALTEVSNNAELMYKVRDLVQDIKPGNFLSYRFISLMLLEESEIAIALALEVLMQEGLIQTAWRGKNDCILSEYQYNHLGVNEGADMGVLRL